MTNEYIVSRLTKIGGHNRLGGDVYHIGVVDHRYGPGGWLAYVKTFCGRKGRMQGQGQLAVPITGDCKSCLRVAKARSSA